MGGSYGMGLWIKVAGVAVAVVFTVSVFFAWREAQKQQMALQAELKTTQQALADASAREASRDAAVKSLTAQIRQQKAEVQTPAQLIQALPDVLPLPTPLAIAPERMDSPPSSGQAEGETPKGKNTMGGANEGAQKLEFPAADLKPLYDFALDCKSCQAQLGAAEADLKDEKAKEAALGRERDDALKAAKGGSVLRRVARAAKWFAIGAAAGAIAAKAVR